jgi:hypothetical protein
MIIRDVCPRCQSPKFKKNGHIHNGKKNHHCHDCGRQFVQCCEQYLLVREALSVSKQLANYIGAIKLFICHYNLTRAA